MTKADKIEMFIMTCFDELCLDYMDYFSYKGKNGKLQRIPLIRTGKLDEEAVRFASRILGISIADIMACNYEAIAKWKGKFKYFSHYKKLNNAYEENIYGRGYAEHKLKEAIYGIRLPLPVRYNLFNVRDRLIAQLRELNVHLPGTFHEGAEIMDLKFRVHKICHYDGIADLIDSYLQMIERAGELFFKALIEDLCEEEIHEYNIIVSAVGIKDFVFTHKGNLYYDNILNCREIYRRENLPNFYDYITLCPTRSFSPWCCAEFIEDKELVQRYINYHPSYKFVMREFAMEVLNFKCDFAWSDAKLLCLYDGDLISDEEYEILVGEPVPDVIRVPERTEVYVPKTTEELEDNETYARTLLTLSGPEKMGGVALPPHRNDVGNPAKRILERMSSMASSNYAEWYKVAHNEEIFFDGKDRGGSDE